MRHLKLTSVLVLAAGLVVAVAGATLIDDPVWVLTGLLLLWAGIVKIVVMYLWRGLTMDTRTTPRQEE